MCIKCKRPIPPKLDLTNTTFYTSEKACRCDQCGMTNPQKVFLPGHQRNNVDEGQVKRIEVFFKSMQQAEKQWPNSPTGVVSVLG